MKSNKLKTSYKQGFTLIELLVVVLIIGILAAVAVPQYQKAVEKSKSTEAITMLKSIYQSAQDYYLANGKWPTSFVQLSISPAWIGTTKWYESDDIQEAISNEDWSLQISNHEVLQGINIGRLSGKYMGGGFAIWNTYSSSTMPFHTIVCAEKISEIKTAGDYCQKIMNSRELIYTGRKLRYYRI